MKRAMIVATGTVIGAGLALNYVPAAIEATSAASAASGIGGFTPSPTNGSIPTSPNSTSATASPSSSTSLQSTKTLTKKNPSATPTQTPTPKPTPQAAPVTITGTTVFAQYGNVQTAIKVDSSGKITDLAVLKYPNGDQRSASISARAIPILKQEALVSQSANINTVSGASYTSAGFIESLQSAITKGGL